MTTFHILSLFPDQVKCFLDQSIIKRAQKNGLIKVKYWQLRNYTKNRYKTVDDKPYGGGKGMLLKADIVDQALAEIKKKVNDKIYIILTSPKGETYTQTTAKKLTLFKNILIICGHYEGFDARVEKLVDEQISLGDFILTGGELVAAAIVDSVARLIPGVLAEGSLDEETFNKNTLEYPQYTRPKMFLPKSKKSTELEVPKILLSGNHQEIKKWRESKKK